MCMKILHNLTHMDVCIVGVKIVIIFNNAEQRVSLIEIPLNVSVTSPR